MHLEKLEAKVIWKTFNKALKKAEPSLSQIILFGCILSLR
jgi:hypothetical protein